MDEQPLLDALALADAIQLDFPGSTAESQVADCRHLLAEVQKSIDMLNSGMAVVSEEALTAAIAQSESIGKKFRPWLSLW